MTDGEDVESSVERQQFVEETKSDKDDKARCQSKECRVSLIIFFIVIIVVAIIIGATLGATKKDDSEEEEKLPEQRGEAVYLHSKETTELKSPDYPSHYPDMSRQYWIIIAPEDYRVRIKFIDLRTEYRYDSVRIGSSDETEVNYIGSFTGYDLPPIITSSGNALWVQLFSDESSGESGFHAEVTAVQDRDAEFECPEGEKPCKYVEECFGTSHACDGSYKCISGQDEVNCACSNPFHFKCSDGRCLERTKVCDNVTDCSDDEHDCGFECDHGFAAVSNRFVCDGVNDCADYTDERECDCTGTERWECPDGTCIYKNNVCDGFLHCPEGEDEIDCTCMSWQFECTNSGTCIPYWERCDGNDTCGDNSDEQDCPVCPGRLYQCDSFQCLSVDMVCNGNKDCFEGDDELDCANTTIAPCADGEFSCGGKCLRTSLVCDGVRQCRTGADEQNCTADDQGDRTESPVTTPAKSNCTACSSGECFTPASRCDGNADCLSGEDEEGCTTPAPTTVASTLSPCPEGEDVCSSDQSCIPKSRFCNGIRDCPSGEDEDSCTETTDSCADLDNNSYFVCDGKEDCSNGTDENCICGTKPMLKAKIYGGRVVNQKGAWPWQVLITASNSTKGVSCGGSIINRNWIVTAAHCISSRSVGMMYVLAGVTTRTDNHEDIQYRGISKVVRHPKSTMGAYDVALARVTEPFTYTALVQPVCLPEEDTVLEPGEYLTVTGWGETGGGFDGIQLMEVRLPVIPPEICHKWSSFNYATLQERIICAGYERGFQSACYGDSGGPANVMRDGRWTIVGTVSGGTTCGTPYTPNLYTRLTFYLTWIRSVVQELPVL